MITLEWANAGNTIIKVNEDGTIYFVPWPTDSAFGRKIQDAINSGVPIAPFVPPAPSQDELDNRAARQYPKLVALRNMTPAQVQAWVDTNVTDFASAKDALKTLAVAVGILARRV